MGLVVLAGCDGEGKVVLTATLDNLPLVGLEIVALPYDAQSILDSLGRAAPTPPPDYTALEMELRNYQRKDSDSIGNLNTEWAEARRPIADLADTVKEMERGSAEHASAYARFRAAYHALSREEVMLERRMRRELGSDRDLAVRAGAAADSLRRWEEAAYQTFLDVVAGRDGITGSTDSLGQARLELEAGRWWLVARRPDPKNPFMEFAWNVPLVVSSIVPVATPLSRHNVTLRWRR
ncbi:MAG: hypothetical protein V3S60_07330 [Acidimicrobiia bacterium]